MSFVLYVGMIFGVAGVVPCVEAAFMVWCGAISFQAEAAVVVMVRQLKQAQTNHLQTFQNHTFTS